MEEAVPIDATAKVAKRPEPALKSKKTAPKATRPEQSTKTTSDQESSSLISVSSSSETTERLQELEQLVKAYHEQNMKLHKSNEAKLDKVDMKINLLTARFGKMEEQVKNYTEEADSDEHKKKDHDWNETTSSSNYENNLRLPSIDTSRTITPAEPSSELDRILRQMDETEKELHSVRKETFEINLLIEKTWQKDRSTDAIDHLKVKRRRLQSKESRLEEEMRDLEMRLERERNGKHRNTEEKVRSRRHDQPQEERMERNVSRERRHDRDRQRGEERFFGGGPIDISDWVVNVEATLIARESGAI
ncbi:hypothetical protein OSTOST_07146 [Ostertagia ostertagi]